MIYMFEVVNKCKTLLIAVLRDTLMDMVLNMKEDIGIVHQMPYAMTRKGFGSHMEKVLFT